MKRICKIIEADYGRQGCRSPEARDFFIALAALDDTAASGDPSYVRGLPKLTKRLLPCFGTAEQAAALAELQERPVVVTARFLGELLALTDARRDEFCFFDAEAVDMDAAALVAKRQAGDRDRKAAKRREAGIPPRGEAIAYERTLDPDASLRTLQRRAKARREAQMAPRARSRKGSGGPPSASRKMAR